MERRQKRSHQRRRRREAAQEGEEEALRIEQESLANREEIISNQQGIEQLLESEEGSLLDQLNALLQLIQNNSKYLPQLKEIETRIIIGNIFNLRSKLTITPSY